MLGVTQPRRVAHRARIGNEKAAFSEETNQLASRPFKPGVAWVGQCIRRALPIGDLNADGYTLHPYTLPLRLPQLHPIPLRIDEPAEAAVLVPLVLRINLYPGHDQLLIFVTRQTSIQTRTPTSTRHPSPREQASRLYL